MVAEWLAQPHRFLMGPVIQVRIQVVAPKVDVTTCINRQVDIHSRLRTPQANYMSLLSYTSVIGVDKLIPVWAGEIVVLL